VIVNVRPRTLNTRLLLFSMAFGAVLMGVTMPAAKADPLAHAEAEYVVANHGAVCTVIDQYPTEAGVMGVMRGIMSDGWNAAAAVDIINVSVELYCPSNWPLLQAIGDKARGENQISQVWQS
jgi:short subunit fatty acids transporter